MWRHTNSVHRPRLTSDEAMRMWRARDAYRVQSVLVGVIVISLILEALYFVREGCWVTALLTVGPQVLALWGLLWLLGRVRVCVRTWWHTRRSSHV